MARPTRNLHVVPAAPAEPEPSLAYEYEERRRIARMNWAAIHVRGDRGPVIGFADRIMRPWR